MEKIQMIVTVSCTAIVIITLFVCLWGVLNSIWFIPKKLEKLLRKQGLKGNAYRILYGNMNNLSGMIKEATSKPMNLSDDDIVPRMMRLFLETIKNMDLSEQPFSTSYLVS